MIFYFIYETLNLINGRKYRGLHQTENVNDKYLGSGTALRLAIRKYGKENFKRIILEFTDSFENLLELEKKYVDENWLSDSNNYNLKTGGHSAGILCQDSKLKISNSLKEKYKNGYINPRLGVSNIPWNKGLKGVQVPWHAGTKGMGLVVAWNKGLKLDIDPWNKGLNTGSLSENHKNKISSTLKERYTKIDHHNKNFIPWNKDLKGVQTAWNKNKPAEKFECPHCLKMIDKLNLTRWHLDNCKMKVDL